MDDLRKRRVEAAAAAGLAAAAAAGRAPALIRTAGAGAGLLAVYHPLRLAVREHRARETQAFRERSRQALVAAYLAISAELQAEPLRLGLHAYLVQYQLAPPFAPYLGPVARFRLGPRPPSSRIVWRRGVGVVGTAWRRAQPVGMDLGGLRDAVRQADGWNSLKDVDQLGLTWEQFDFLAAHYGSVVAVPIAAAGEPARTVGCVALDATPGVALNDLATPEVLAVLGQTATVLGEELAAAPPATYPGPGVLPALSVVARALMDGQQTR